MLKVNDTVYLRRLVDCRKCPLHPCEYSFKTCPKIGIFKATVTSVTDTEFSTDYKHSREYFKSPIKTDTIGKSAFLSYADAKNDVINIQGWTEGSIFTNFDISKEVK